MATLTVSSSTNFRAEPARSQVTGQSIALIDFTAPTLIAQFESDQFGGTNISDFVTVDGSTGNDIIWLFMASGQTVLSAADWTFTNWDTSNEVWFWGSAAADTLTGSSVKDTLVLDGSDTLVGGAGDDLFLIDGNDSFSGAQLDGGTGTLDRLLIDNTADLRNVTFTNIEGLARGDFGVKALLSGAQVGAGKINIFSDDSGVGGFAVEIVGASINLSTAQFVTWVDGDTITLTGTAGNDTITGSSQKDFIASSGGNDTLNGGGGSDLIDAFSGNDSLNGGAGGDTLIGGDGNDTYVVDSTLDSTSETNASLATGGNDIVFSSVTRTLGANIEKLTLTGIALTGGTGNALANTLLGNGAANTLKGLDGNDTITGGAGNDTLLGGLGRDVLTGGTNADRFDFDFVSHTGKTAATRDVITDFTHAGTLALSDRIDLATIDANGSGANNTAFAFLATKGALFTGLAGQLRWFQSDPAGTLSDKTIVEGDINGDKIADFQIELTGLKNLVALDFVL